MKSAFIWLRPTRSAAACRYSYDPEKGGLTVGRRMESDCAVWLTYFIKEIVVDVAVGTTPSDVCPLCKLGARVAPMRELPALKPRQPPLQFLHRNS